MVTVTIMHYNIPRKKFKSLGYDYTCKGYQTYSLRDKTNSEVGSPLLYAFPRGKDIELPTFEFRTFDVIEEYKRRIKNKQYKDRTQWVQGRKDFNKDLSPTQRTVSVRFLINMETGEIIEPADNYPDGDWREFSKYNTSFDLILKEIDKLNITYELKHFT